MARQKQIKTFLDQLLDQIDWSRERKNDPVEYVWKFSKNCNQEVVALLASSLAYGKASQIQKAVEDVLMRFDEPPVEAITRRSSTSLSERLSDFRYRMTAGSDLVDLFWAIRNALDTFGSLEQMYRTRSGENHLQKSSQFVDFLRNHRYRSDLTRGFKYLLPNPADGSACKRLHLFFRWVGRPSGPIDPGCWASSTLNPADLLIPLDTHTSRISRYIGLNKRKSVDGKAARQVTKMLRKLDSEDPIKYDFALCHLGISKQCIHEYSDEHCPDCPIFGICSLAEG